MQEALSFTSQLTTESAEMLMSRQPRRLLAGAGSPLSQAVQNLIPSTDNLSIIAAAGMAGSTLEGNEDAVLGVNDGGGEGRFGRKPLFLNKQSSRS